MASHEICICGCSLADPPEAHRYIDEDLGQALLARKHNIAVWIIENYAKFVGCRVNSIKIRDNIRSALGLTLDQYAYDKQGDLAVHGDALGKKTGLALDDRRPRLQGGPARVILINRGNLDRSCRFLATSRISADVVL